MATLKSDIIGRVARLPIRPSERGALLPLMEAVSNSIQSVTDVFENQTNKKGHITVTIIRANDEKDPAIIGFVVEDNGAGFTDENYHSFLTPDSRLKLKRGGKGVGRLAWLKVFKKISVVSTFKKEKKLYQRSVVPVSTTEDDQVPGGEPVEVSGKKQATIITFSDFNPEFDRRCPTKGETIAHRIVSHFVPLFVGGNAPHVVVIDGRERIDAEAMFSDAIVDQSTSAVEFEENGKTHSLSLWNLKC